MAEATRRTTLEKALGLFTEVKVGEGISALLLTFNVFLLLTSYYIIKPVRDALISAMPNGPEYKSYMGAAIAVALLFAVPAYAGFAKKLPRNKLVVGATLFFVSHIVLFAIGTQVPGSDNWLPLAFYLWVGIFNMMVVAQFWAFANDVYNEEQGKRLFALIGIGASAGAAVGGALAKWLPRRPVPALEGGCGAKVEEVGFMSTFQLLILAGVLLALCALISQIVHVRESHAPAEAAPKGDDEVDEASSDGGDLPPATKKATKASSGAGAFGMVFKYRYLLLLASFSLLFTLVNTNGEYMISRLVKNWVFETLDKCVITDEATKSAFISGMFTSWYGDFYFYVNVVGVLIQSFAVSRLVKFGGLKVAFFVLPVIACLGAVSLLVIPVMVGVQQLAVLRPAKIAENSTDYSLNNTVRNMLWLPTTKAMKYQAKQAVDTFFVRMGDVGSGLLVFIIADVLGNKGVTIFVVINLVLIFAWFFLARGILKEMEVLKKMRQDGELVDEDDP